MQKRLISICTTAVLACCIYGCVQTAEETLFTKSETVEAEHTEVAGQEVADAENVDKIVVEEEQEQDELEPYYGFYKISEFYPTLYWGKGVYKYDNLTEQEADMLLGRIVELGADRLVTYDSLRDLGTRDGRVAFPGNYIIEEIVIDDPQYSWQPLTAEAAKSDIVSIGTGGLPEEYVSAVKGKIDIQIATPFGNHYYYVMPDGILMYSTLTCQYYYLGKLEKEPERQEKRVLSAEEKSDILQELLGIYTVVEFLPTKFYPAPDTNGDPYLPEEEAELMIGKEITVEEDIFVSYDNFRRPNSEIVKRSMDDFWVERVDIPAPDYQIEAKDREELYGLRDDMLREELLQDRYIEISVFPGYSANSEKCLTQLYLLDDGRIIMYSMGEYFLLEKKVEPVTVMSKKTRFDIDGSVHMWEEYEYDAAGNMTKYTGYLGSDGSFWFGLEYEYDSKSKLTKDTYCGADGEIDYWNEYEYDNAGNQVKHARYDADGSISYWEKYEYDSAGNQVKRTRYNADNDINYWYEYEFDSMGNQTKTTEYSKRGDIVGWFEWEYDSAGNLTKEKNNFKLMSEYEYDDVGNQTKYSYYTNDRLNMWYEYEYDSMGNHTKGITYNADGSIQSIQEYEYDSRGNKTKVAYDYVYGIPTGHEPEHEWEYEWEYDSMGNLTKYMEYSWGKVFDWYEYEYITITPQ